MFEKDNLENIVNILDEGGIILYPTDTIWALGCDAYNEKAIEKIFTIKKRSKDKPLSILVDCVDMIKSHVAEIHPKIETLLAYHERPLTVIYEKARKLPRILISNDGSIAIRLVQDAFCTELIQALGRPIVSTSANMSDQTFPVNFGHISSDILSQADYIVRHRQDDKTHHEPSVVIRMSKKSELIFVRD